MDVKLTKFEAELCKKGKAYAALDSMLSRFNRIVQEYGLLKELKERRFYKKPSDIKSKKRLDKLIKSRRTNALHKKRVQGSFRQGYKRVGGDSKARKN